MPIDKRSIARSFPALATLNLTKAHLDDLANQGTLREEASPSSRGAFKLRFRSGGKQVVRYLGRGSEFVDRVRRELAELQGEVKERRQSRRLIGAALSQLRSAKRRLEPLLPLAGYRFHGRAIRLKAKNRDVGRVEMHEVSEVFLRSSFMDESTDGRIVESQPPQKTVPAGEAMKEKRRTLFDELRSEALETPNRLQAAFRFEGAFALEIETLLGERIVNRLRADTSDEMPSNETISLIAVKAVVHRQAMQCLQVDREISESQPSWNGPTSMAISQAEK